MSAQLVETVTNVTNVVEYALYLRDDKSHELTFQEWKARHGKFGEPKQGAL